MVFLHKFRFLFIFFHDLVIVLVHLYLSSPSCEYGYRRLDVGDCLILIRRFDFRVFMFSSSWCVVYLCFEI